MKTTALIVALAFTALAAPTSASSVAQDAARMLPTLCDGNPDRKAGRSARGGIFSGMTCGEAVVQNAIANVYIDAYERIIRMPEYRATDKDGDPTPNAQRLHVAAHLNYCASHFGDYMRLSRAENYRSVGTRVMRLSGCGKF